MCLLIFWLSVARSADAKIVEGELVRPEVVIQLRFFSRPESRSPHALVSFSMHELHRLVLSRPIQSHASPILSLIVSIPHCLTSSLPQNWAFLTRFCFMEAGGKFEYEVSYPKVSCWISTSWQLLPSVLLILETDYFPSALFLFLIFRSMRPRISCSTSMQSLSGLLSTRKTK